MAVFGVARSATHRPGSSRVCKPFGLSVRALVRDRDGRCLVIRRSRESSFWPGRWDLPGGKLDPGETFDGALVREVKEETGLDVGLAEFAGAAGWELPHIRLVFVCMTADIIGGELRLSEEHDEHLWIAHEQISTFDLCDPIVKALGTHNRERGDCS